MVINISIKGSNKRVYSNSIIIKYVKLFNNNVCNIKQYIYLQWIANNQ